MPASAKLALAAWLSELSRGLSPGYAESCRRYVAMLRADAERDAILDGVTRAKLELYQGFSEVAS